MGLLDRNEVLDALEKVLMVDAFTTAQVIDAAYTAGFKAGVEAQKKETVPALRVVGETK